MNVTAEFPMAEILSSEGFSLGWALVILFAFVFLICVAAFSIMRDVGEGESETQDDEEKDDEELKEKLPQPKQSKTILPPRVRYINDRNKCPCGSGKDYDKCCGK